MRLTRPVIVRELDARELLYQQTPEGFEIVTHRGTATLRSGSGIAADWSWFLWWRDGFKSRSARGMVELRDLLDTIKCRTCSGTGNVSARRKPGVSLIDNPGERKCPRCKMRGYTTKGKP